MKDRVRSESWPTSQGAVPVKGKEGLGSQGGGWARKGVQFLTWVKLRHWGRHVPEQVQTRAPVGREAALESGTKNDCPQEVLEGENCFSH